MSERAAVKAAKSSLAHRAFFSFCRSFSLAVFTLAYRLRRLHIDRVPRTGPVLIVANHQSYLDPPLIGVCLSHREIHPVARVGLFNIRPLAWLIRALNAIPIREGAGDVAAMKEALMRLKNGAAVVIFPEGSRTFDGAVSPFQRGAALLVKRSSCPVLPIAIEGPYDAWPRSRKRPRFWRQRISIMVGEPIAHDELLKDGPDAALERLRREISTMRDQLHRMHRASRHQ